MGKQNERSSPAKCTGGTYGVRFPTTSWTELDSVRNPASTGYGQSLEGFYNRYLAPLRILSTRSLRMSNHEADEVLHDFFVSKIMEKNLISAVDPNRGMFRAFICRAYVNFVKDAWKAKNIEAKRLRQITLMLQTQNEAEGPSKLTLEWCRSLIMESIARMESECRATGRDANWIAFRAWVIDPLLHGKERPAIDELRHRLDLSANRSAYNKIETGKRVFSRHLRSLVAMYQDDEAIDTEISALMSTLAKANG